MYIILDLQGQLVTCHPGDHLWVGVRVPSILPQSQYAEQTAKLISFHLQQRANSCRNFCSVIVDLFTTDSVPETDRGMVQADMFLYYISILLNKGHAPLWTLLNI